MLTACYDLKYSPPTYDVVAFVLMAETERIKLGEQQVRIVIYPGPDHGFRKDGMWPKDPAVRRAMMEAIVLPMCRMLPTAVAVDWLTDRPPLDSPSVGGNTQLHGLDKIVRGIKGAGRPLRPKEELPKQADLVTITLRESEHWTRRNSNVPEWLKAAMQIGAMGYRVVFVRDTFHATDTLHLFPNDPEASVNLEARARLYRSAYCNFFISNGPAWLSLALDAPTLMLRPVDDKINGCYSSHFFQSCGIPKGGQVPNTGPHQRLVWQQDTATHIMDAFLAFKRDYPLAA